MPAVTIDEITVSGDASSWAVLGFGIRDESLMLGSVTIRFTEHEAHGGILGWSLNGVESTELDGLPTARSTRPAPAPDAPEHANSVIAIDHVVAMTPDLDRTVGALQAAGLDLRRIRDEPTPAGAPRQAFFRLGREILEVVQEPEEVIAQRGDRDQPARFWGLALLVDDMEAAAAALGPSLSPIRAAVQPGRRIATVARTAGLSVPVALMSLEGGGPG